MVVFYLEKRPLQHIRPSQKQLQNAELEYDMNEGPPLEVKNAGMRL